MEALLHELFIICLLSSAVIYICHKMKVSPIVGFLITGILCGPHTFALVKDMESVMILAEIGIVFLLFTIGLEISIGELIRLRKPVFLGGSFQVFLTIAVFWGLTEWVWHDTTGADLFVGFLIALSSTAIVLQALQRNAMMESPAGRISLSILIYQDLVIVPMMLLIPVLAGRTQPDMEVWPLAVAAVKTLGLIVAVFLLARKIVPMALHQIIRTKSRELFLITIIGICLGTAYATEEIGLSLSLGAFMAGLVVAESEYSHSALEGILPFKEVFTSMFFISVGMLLDLNYFFSNVVEIMIVTALVIGLKASIVVAGAKILGYPLRTALITGLALCQVGEFSFVLAKQGADFNLLSPDHYQLFLAASILTMAATPFLISAAPSLSRKFCNFCSKKGMRMPEETEAVVANEHGLTDHLIILGYGVGGKLLARAAKMAGIRYIILEMNPDTVRTYAAQGEPIVHGDAIHEAMLNHLGVKSARVLAIVISDPTATRVVSEIASRMNNHLHILVRTRFLGEVNSLKELGASEVIPEEFETAIEIFTRVLSQYLVPRKSIEQFTHSVRAENYEMLRRVEQTGAPMAMLKKQMPDICVSVFELEKEAPLDGQTLVTSSLRQQANVTVVAVTRDSETYAHPGGDFRLMAGDHVYVFSSPAAAAEAQYLFRGVGSLEEDQLAS